MSQYLDQQLARESQRGRLDRVEKLLERGAAIDKARGLTPLQFAVAAGHVDVVRLLVARGAQVDFTRSSEATPLALACIRGHERIALLLIDMGANVNAVRDSGPSVLNYAVGKNGSITLIEALLGAGASAQHRYLGMDMVQYAEWCKRSDLAQLFKRKARRLVKSQRHHEESVR